MEEKTIITGLYWRKNWLQAVPVILRLDGDTITLKTTTKTVWHLQISQTTCRFSSFGTMLIKAQGKEYAFTPEGAVVSSAFTSEQLEELGTTEQAKDTMTRDAAVRLGAAIASTAKPAGVVGAPLAAAYAASLGRMDDWRVEYEKRQLLTRNAGGNAGRNLFLLLIGSVVIGIGLVILFKVVLKVD